MLWEDIHKNKEYIISGVSAEYRTLIDPALRTMRQVMEIGCGTGRNIRYVHALRPDIELFASDIAPEAFTDITHLNIETLVADMRDCSVPSEYLTHAISWRVLHHHDEHARHEAVEEMRRVLAPHGKAVIAVRSVNDWSYGFGTPTEKNSFVVLDQNELPEGLVFFPKKEYHAWHFFPEGEIIDLLERHQFRIDTMFPMEEPAGIPSWYKGNNAYWVVQATKTRKGALFTVPFPLCPVMDIPEGR